MALMTQRVICGLQKVSLLKVLWQCKCLCIWWPCRGSIAPGMQKARNRWHTCWGCGLPTPHPRLWWKCFFSYFFHWEKGKQPKKSLPYYKSVQWGKEIWKCEYIQRLRIYCFWSIQTTSLNYQKHASTHSYIICQCKWLCERTGNWNPKLTAW